MNTKIIKNYTYSGFGFPIELHNVEMIMFNGELHAKIDIRKVSDSAIKSLILQPSRLTGNQIKFVRTYFSMSLRKFSEVVNESHMAIKKWEDFKDKQTNMDLNIEISLRLHIFANTAVKTERDKIKFYNQYIRLKKMFSNVRYKKAVKVQS